MGELSARIRRFGASSAVLGAALWLCSCVPVPVFTAPPVTGRVVDAASKAPIAGALVVVRYDARYDELLPDRDVLGYRELTSAADGSFQQGRTALPGHLLASTEARVVGVMARGYRCPSPRVVSGAAVVLELQPAADEDDRRDSCRPLGARGDETPQYHAAWQALHPRTDTRAQREQERDLERVLAARSSFGFGENCRGPVVDLALSPDGRYVAWRTAVGATSRVEVRAMSKPTAPFEQLDVSGAAERRLAWTARGDLVLWEPANELERALSPSQLSAGGIGPQSLWRSDAAANPAAAMQERRGGAAVPLEPSDLRDEGDARWMGRSFRVTRELDPESGLSRDSLRITAPGRPTRTLELPGEACGARGEFGAPQLRIAADTRTALDLRDAGEGCSALAIDLDTGAWTRLDKARGRVCAVERSVPVGHLRTAARGFTAEVEEALAKVGADPKASFWLRIEPNGSTSATSIDYTGALVHTDDVPRFPMRTPLQKIELGVMGASRAGIGGGAPTPMPAADQPEPL
jgi:hypothetical protein